MTLRTVSISFLLILYAAVNSGCLNLERQNDTTEEETFTHTAIVIDPVKHPIRATPFDTGEIVER